MISDIIHLLSSLMISESIRLLSICFCLMRCFCLNTLGFLGFKLNFCEPMTSSLIGSVVLVLPTDPDRPRPLVPEILFDAMFLFDGYRMFILGFRV